MILLSTLIGVKSFNYFATLCRTAVSKVVKEQIINFLIVDFLFKYIKSIVKFYYL